MKNIKKIIFFCPYFPPHLGGTEMYVYHIAQGLKTKFGMQIVIVTSQNKDKNIKKSVYRGMTIYRLPVLFTLSNTPINPLWYFQIKNILRIEKPDLINAHAPVPFMADLAALVCKNIPFILTYHTVTMKKSGSLFNFPISIYERLFLPFMLKKAKRIITSSDYIKSSFLKHYTKKIITINPGVSKVKKINKRVGGVKQVLFIAGLAKSQRYKGLEDLLNAMTLVKSQSKNIKLLVAGEGDGLSLYKELANKLKISDNVKFLGGVRGRRLDSLYSKVHLLVLPSLNESFGMVLIEAMAHCTPVIGTKIGGIPQIITHNKDGYLVSPKNPDDLAKAILKVLNDNRLIRKMGLAGYLKVKNNFLWKFQVQKTGSLFQAI